jgi:hypothetical protein
LYSARQTVFIHREAARKGGNVPPGELSRQAFQGEAEDLVFSAVCGIRGEGHRVAIGGISASAPAAVEEDGLALHELEHVTPLQLINISNCSFTGRQSQHGMPLE